MGQEIERKYLVKGDQWRSQAQGKRYRQGYLSLREGLTVRVRIVGDHGYLTIKGPSQGITRPEFEYEIPLADAQMMLDTLCDRPLIEKIRYRLPQGELVWEIDEFAGENAGLILAEVELEHEQQTIPLPEWITKEVNDPKYFNVNLAKHPYQSWSHQP